MGEVIEFIPANRVEVDLELETVTIESVMEAMLDRYDIVNMAIVYEDGDGMISICSDTSEVDAYNLLADAIEGM